MATVAQHEARHYNTIVIGAGMAGLACASKLYQHPAYRKPGALMVLEARDRIGGRINSVHVHGSRLDTGANWIHGIGTKEEPNPLVNLLPHKRYRELSGTVAFETGPEASSKAEISSETVEDDWVRVDTKDEDNTLGKASTTDRVIPSEDAEQLIGSMWGVIGALHEVAVETDPSKAKGTTMLQAIHQCTPLRDGFRNLPKEYHSTLSALPQFIENMEAAPLTARSAEHSSDHPGMGLLEFALDDFDGDQVFLQDGYLAVINEVAKDLVKDRRIETSIEVTSIKWDTNPITISTTKDTYNADHVVCTLPLGVLQHHLTKTDTPFFQPALPSPKLSAVKATGFGTLDKIFLVYSHPWWTEEPYRSLFSKGLTVPPGSNTPSPFKVPDSLMGPTPHLPGTALHADGRTTAGPGMLSVINLHALTGQLALSAFVSCSNATFIESLSDAEAGDIVYDTLTSWLGRAPPRPEAVHVTRWAGDEFSRGSYSHMIAGLSETKHREEMASKVVGEQGGELRFAGEHTSRNHFATVHGALISGWREADALLKRE